MSDASPKTSAEEVLRLLLRQALRDEEKCAEIVHQALVAAKREQLPEDSLELLAFVKAYLAPQLSFEVPPALVFAFIDDLTAQLEHGQATEKSPSSSPGRTALPVASASQERPRADRERAGGKSPARFPRLRDSVANLVRTVSTKLEAVRATGIAGVLDRGRRATVIVVESDRLARSSLARALVNARFDVSVVDRASQVAGEVRGRESVVVAIGNLREPGLESTLRALVEAHPGLAVLAWTSAPAAEAEGVMAAAGVTRFGVVPRAATQLEFVSGLRRLLVQRSFTAPPVSGTQSRGDADVSADQDRDTKRRP